MSTVQKQHHSIVIAAPAEQVYTTMIDPEAYKRWTAAFAEGSYFQGSWEKGARILFLSPTGCGMLATIAENRPFEYISIRHLGEIDANGVEDTESEKVRAWAPAHENYTFTEVDGGTEVAVEMDVVADWEEYMKETWPKALVLLKDLCEGR